MEQWIRCKDALPLDQSYVKVKKCIFFPFYRKVMFTNNYFVYRGKNITAWVTHWDLSSVESALLVPIKIMSREEYYKLFESTHA